MKTLLWIFLLQITIFNVVRAQSPQQVLKWINTVKTDEHYFYYEIPFEYRNNEIVIKVAIGNETYDYIFDTSGYNDITDEIQSKNNFPVLTTQTVGSSNKLKTKVNMVRVDSLKIGPLVFQDVAALQMNFDNSPTIKCTINGALIGASIIKKYIWQIDYPNKKIIVTDQLGKLPGLDNAVKVPVIFNSRLMPYINAKIDGRDERFMFDLGSSSLFVLTEKAAQKDISGKQIIEVNGGGTEGGNGVVKQTIKIIKADSLEIASVQFKDKPVFYTATANECLIGNPIIKNYIVTLNFNNNELYFAPITQAPVEQGWASFGFGMEYIDGKVIVSTLYKSLAADKAGVVLKDEVIAVDAQQLNYGNQCEALAPLAALLNIKTAITLTVLRNGIKKDIKINKEKVF